MMQEQEYCDTSTMKLLFDTNVFRDIQRGTISATHLARAKSLLNSEDQGFLSPLSLIELGSHINDDEKANFEQFRAALNAACELCSDALPDPDQVLRHSIFGAKPDHGLQPEDTLKIARMIAEAPSYDLLVNGQITTSNGVTTRSSYQPELLKQFREAYEKQYVEGMHNHVVSLFCPDWEEKRATGRMAKIDNPETMKSVSSYLESDEFKKYFIEQQADRVNVTLPAGFEWEKLFSRMKPFFDAYVWILRAIAQSGYNPQKNKNDCNDIDFLLYLSDPDLRLITRDGGISRKIGDSERVMTFEAWLASSPAKSL